MPEPIMLPWSLYTDYARQFNMIMLILVIAGLTANMIVRRHKMLRRTRRIFGWIFALLINFTYGYAISIQNHRPFNLSVGIGSFLLIGTVLAIAWHPEGDETHPPHDGSLPERFMEWLDQKVRDYKTRHKRGKEHA